MFECLDFDKLLNALISSWGLLICPGNLAFAQLIVHQPLTTFRHCVARSAGHHKVKCFTRLEQFVYVAVSQLTSRERPISHSPCRQRA